MATEGDDVMFQTVSACTFKNQFQVCILLSNVNGKCIKYLLQKFGANVANMQLYSQWNQ